jgi:hypothetical protein
MAKAQKDRSSMQAIKKLFDYNKEVTIYDYFKDEILSKLGLKELNELKNDLIHDILIYDNEKLHNKILSWMIDKKLYSDLEKVDSKHYNKFIDLIEKKHKLDINDVALVYKYLEKTNQFNRLICFLMPVIFTDESVDN